MAEIVVHVEVEVNPTESEEKVKRAVESIFGSIQTKMQPVGRRNTLTAEARGPEALTGFRNLLRREHIRAAARAALLEGLNRETISFCLNKQVAYARHVSFAREMAESPLGPIKVRIECKNPRQLVDWLTSQAV